MNKLELDLNEYWELIDLTISTGGEFRLYHKGKSMNPLLRQGIDSVILVTPTNVKKNDIVMYRRANGQLVMHRIIKIKKDEYIMCGDNQFAHEHGIRREDILAKVKGIYRDEAYFEEDNKQYKKYVSTLPLRRLKYRFIHYFNKMKKS